MLAVKVSFINDSEFHWELVNPLKKFPIEIAKNNSMHGHREHFFGQNFSNKCFIAQPTTTTHVRNAGVGSQNAIQNVTLSHQFARLILNCESQDNYRCAGRKVPPLFALYVWDAVYSHACLSNALELTTCMPMHFVFSFFLVQSGDLSTIRTAHTLLNRCNCWEMWKCETHTHIHTHVQVQCIIGDKRWRTFERVRHPKRLIKIN